MLFTYTSSLNPHNYPEKVGIIFPNLQMKKLNCTEMLAHSYKAVAPRFKPRPVWLQNPWSPHITRFWVGCAYLRDAESYLPSGYHKKGDVGKSLIKHLVFPLPLLRAPSTQLAQAAHRTHNKHEITQPRPSAESLAEVHVVPLLRTPGDSRNHAGRLHLRQFILTDQTNKQGPDT